MAIIPQDCVSEILSYLPEGGGALRQYRTEKSDIKEYLNSFCMCYTSSNLKYFNRLKKRAWAVPNIKEHDEGHGRAARAFINAEAENRRVPSNAACLHQCCGLTRRGHRCRNKTFGLFCGRHEGSITCYWTSESLKVPPQLNHSLEDFHAKGLQEAEEELRNLELAYPPN